MSSFSLDVSGKRALSSTINDDARTSVSIPSKAGDDTRITLNSFEEVTIYLPATAKLQLVRVPHKKDDGYDELIRLSVPGQSLTIGGHAGEQGWPHVGVVARKGLNDQNDYFLDQADGEIVNEVPVAAAALVKVEVVGAEPAE